jgi:hypothetical protein
VIKRWFKPEIWFADKVREGYYYALVTTNRVRPTDVPGDHVSIVVDGKRKWGFKHSHERDMAQRIAGGEVR